MKNTLSIIIILLSFAIAVYFYPQMPERMASHWDSQGNINGYMSRFWALAMGPLVILGLYLLFEFIPRIDPLKKNIKKFKKHYDTFKLVLIGFMFYIYLASIAANLGYVFDMSFVMIPGLSILFFYCGVLMQHSKRNWFIGIKTPWTLSSDKVWKKTHEMGGKMFKAYALLILLGLFFGSYGIYFIVLPIIVIVIWSLVYSYLEYQKRGRK